MYWFEHLLQDMHRALQRFAETYDHPGKDKPYGGYHIIFSGDFNQHQPVNLKPLFYGARNPEKLNVLEQKGRHIWEQVDTVVILKEQNRFDVSQEGGRRLWDIISTLLGKNLKKHQIADILDTLNSRVISSDALAEFMASNPPKIIVLRNDLRPPLNATLLLNQARLSKEKIFVWKSIDVLAGSKARPNQQVRSALDRLPNNCTGLIPTFGFYFAGIQYRFVDSKFPEVGRTNNNTCVGRNIVLDIREDPQRIQTALNDMTVSRIYLQYPPSAIMVEPDGQHQYDPPTMPGVPERCIPVHCTVSIQFIVQLPKEGHKPIEKIKIKRTGIALEATEVNTDFFSQGMSFQPNKPYLLHLTLPPGPFTKANLLVPISRPRSLDDLHLLTPLWRTAQERLKVIDRVFAAFKANEDMSAEYDRFAHLSEETERRYGSLLN